MSGQNTPSLTSSYWSGINFHPALALGHTLGGTWKMAKSRTELMVDRLRDLQSTTPEIEASAVVSVDGLIIASSLPPGIEEDRVSAMSAAMLSLGERISNELGRG